jgi:hypothetical protein
MDRFGRSVVVAKWRATSISVADPRGIVHGAVVDAIAVDRGADPDVIEVGGEDDVLACQRGIAAR